MSIMICLEAPHGRRIIILAKGAAAGPMQAIERQRQPPGAAYICAMLPAYSRQILEEKPISRRAVHAVDGRDPAPAASRIGAVRPTGRPGPSARPPEVALSPGNHLIAQRKAALAKAGGTGYHLKP
jgi:hypothetical protein